MRHIVIEPGRALLEAIRKYRRGAEHLLGGSVSETEFLKLYEAVIGTAQRAGELSPVLTDLPEEFELQGHSPAFVRHELQVVADTLGISTNRASKIVLRADSIDDQANAPSAVVQALAENHAAFMQVYRESMEKKRADKKKRRRQVRASVELGLAGAVIAASNALTIGPNYYAKESIMFGGGLIVKAAYDIRKG